MEMAETRIPTKDRSTIAFPYGDLGDGIKVAEGLLQGGGIPMSRDQLAAVMGQVPTSGSFNAKVNTARMFGVMDNSGGKYQLTELGHEIVDSDRQEDAMARAFLNVELYKRMYDEFRGKRLPPRPHGLESAFIQLGVAPKQARNARVAFDKSARMAGFFPNGDENRLVMPFMTGSRAFVPVADEEEPVVVEATGTAAARGAAQGVSQPALPPLEYQLVDLLKAKGIGEQESQAIWTLVRFLSAQPKGTGE